MLAFALFVLALFSIIPPIVGQSWWTVEWDAQEFTSFSGDMIVPNTPNAGGTPYVWPGLQPGSTGVLQAVLDGRCVLKFAFIQTSSY